MNLRSVAVLILAASAVLGQTRDTRVAAPRFWNDRELADWALPVAGLNVPVAFFREGLLRRSGRRVGTNLPCLLSGTRTGRILGSDSRKEAGTADHARRAHPVRVDR